MSSERGFLTGKDLHGETYRVPLSDDWCPWCGPEADVCIDPSDVDFMITAAKHGLIFYSCNNCGRYFVKKNGEGVLSASDGSLNLYRRLVAARFYNAVDAFQEAYRNLGPALEAYRNEVNEIPDEPWMDLSGARDLGWSIMWHEDFPL